VANSSIIAAAAAVISMLIPAGHGGSSPVIDRGIALHKMIRLITMALGGEDTVILSVILLHMLKYQGTECHFLIAH
jgi:hypothetical protein